ncbi:MAG: ABC transporter permease subunit [Oscillospiraceae bacterium]|jgi:putative spermidine/putrescine transport system permease protein|nr:ABC transporter permease subunit [Oscillospiraceae bacterium]
MDSTLRTKKKLRKITKIILTFFVLQILFVAIFIPFCYTILWSLVDPEVGWSYTSLFPQRLSFYHWIYQFTYTQVMQGLINGFIIASWTTMLTFLVALPTSYALGRIEIPGKEALKIFVLLPMVLPGMAIAMFLGRILFYLGLSQTYAGVILGHVFMNLPFMIRVLTVSFEGIPQDVVEVSAVLGANRFQRFREVYLPLIIPGFFAAGLNTFISSLEEFDISFIIGQPKIPTISTILFSSMGTNFVKTQVSVNSLLLIIPNFILLFLIERVLKQDYLGASLGKL